MSSEKLLLLHLSGACIFLHIRILCQHCMALTSKMRIVGVDSVRSSWPEVYFVLEI